jgi:hypothetical protein
LIWRCHSSEVTATFKDELELENINHEGLMGKQGRMHAKESCDVASTALTGGERNHGGI